MKTIKKLSLFLLTLVMIWSCNSDPDPLTISSIVANGTSFEDGSAVSLDLNGAASAIDVPVNALITVTFDREILETSIDGNVSISSAAPGVGGTITSSTKSITVTPSGDFQRGTAYTLNLANIMAVDEGLLESISRTFTTEGKAPVVVPNADNQIAYWSFDGSADDLTGDFPADNVVALTFGTDRYGQANSTASFDGDASIIEVLDGDRLMAANDLTLSFWVKPNSVGHVNADGNPTGHFVFGLGAFFGMQFEIPGDYSSCKLALSYVTADGETTGEDLWFNGSGEDKDNGGWQGWDYVANLTGSGGVATYLQDKWTHVVCTYDAEAKRGSMYFNGDLMKSQDFNLWPEGDPKQTVTGVQYRGTEPDVENILAFGFIKSIDSQMWNDTGWGGYSFPTANHFKGDLDDFRVFNVAYSGDDVKALYDAEKN